MDFLSKLQNDIFIVCPALEDLCIHLPDSKTFSGEYLSAMKEEFLQKLNLKRLAIEVSHETEEIWNSYQGSQAIERAEDKRIEEFERRFKSNGLTTEELVLFYEAMNLKEDDSEGFFFESDAEQDYLLQELYFYERNRDEEQDDAERMLHEELTDEEECESREEIYD